MQQQLSVSCTLSLTHPRCPWRAAKKASPESAPLCSHPGFLFWLSCCLRLGFISRYQPSFYWLELCLMLILQLLLIWETQVCSKAKDFPLQDFALPLQECVMAGSSSGCLLLVIYVLFSWVCRGFPWLPKPKVHSSMAPIPVFHPNLFHS